MIQRNYRVWYKSGQGFRFVLANNTAKYVGTTPEDAKKLLGDNFVQSIQLSRKDKIPLTRNEDGSYPFVW